MLVGMKNWDEIPYDRGAEPNVNGVKLKAEKGNDDFFMIY